MISSLDHLVLTVRNVATSADFYRRVLGRRPETFGQGRTVLHLGRQKINPHPAAGPDARPRLRRPVFPGRPLLSIYIRDPDSNLVEIAEP